MRDEIISSHDNNGSRIAKLITPIDIQDAHIVHHYPNFFVLAPSPQKREARIALEEMEADTVKFPAVHLKHMTPRSIAILKEEANPDTSLMEQKEPVASRSAPVAVASERPGIFARMSAWKIPNWLETILIMG